MAQLTLTIDIGDVPARAKDKQKQMQAIANLPADDLQRITELATNPKALAALKSKWAMLKMMF